MNLQGHGIQVVRPEPGEVVGYGDVDQGMNLWARTLQRQRMALIAILFSVVESRQDHLGLAPGYAICETIHACFARFDQGDDTAWCFGRTAMIVAALPEPARPAVQARRTSIIEGYVRVPDQRAVSEQPEATVDIEGNARMDRLDLSIAAKRRTVSALA